MDLQGKKAFVAGAGRGIGRACCVRLAGMGAEILAVSRTASDLQKLAESLSPGNHTILPADLVATEGIERLLFELEEQGYPDIIIANVNMNFPPARIGSRGFSLHPDHILTNTKYLLRIMPGALEHQREKGFGRWIAISSLVARRGGPGQTSYIACKNVLESIIRNIALENGDCGVTANTVMPGIIDTAGLALRYSKDLLRRVERMNALGRMGTADEVAHAVAFLADPRAAYVTGITLPVCGGADLNWFLNQR